MSSARGRRSAGLLLYRRNADSAVEVLLGHPGGPLWARRDAGAWSIPKGEYDATEDPLAAACREFAEEVGSPAPTHDYLPLGEARQRSGKIVTAWAVAGELDTATSHSNTFQMQWPPRSGRIAEFPEIDRTEWFGLAEARDKIVSGQLPFLDRLGELLD